MGAVGISLARSAVEAEELAEGEEGEEELGEEEGEQR